MNSQRSNNKKWHQLSVEQVIGHWGTHIKNGLRHEEVNKRLLMYGPNQLESSKQRRWWQILSAQLTDFMIGILLVAGVVSGLLGEWTDTLVILLIVGANALIGTFQELKAQSSLQALKSMATPLAKGIRHGQHQVYAIHEIVPGDLILVEAGDIIPADLRWVETQGLHIDESPLTGESVSTNKQAQILHPEDTYLAERSNLGHKGTRVTKGRGLGVVVATGKHTQLGKIAHDVATASVNMTPLQEQMGKFGKRLTLILLGLCLLVFVEGLLRGGEITEMFLTAVGLAVAAIPESLPTVVTLALSLGALRLSRHKALVRRLSAVEGLGAVTVVCTDKTGTLTQNKMVVEQFWSPEKKIKRLVSSAILNNDVQINPDGGLLGDPTELALMQWGMDKLQDDEDVALLRLRYPRVFELPFDSNSRTMSTVHQVERSYDFICKGAPESIFNRVSEAEKLSSSFNQATLLAQDWAKQGLRVIAFAEKRVSTLPGVGDDSHIWERDLELVGMLALMDPPREEVPSALSFCKKAHIQVKMITGDHPLTAQAIGERLGLTDGQSLLATGRDLEQWSDNELLAKMNQIKVFARVSPDQKLRLVKLLKARGEFVAMTGDGVNDAPALKESDIGVSMGLSGTDVAKDASDLTLLDDNFATLINAIKEGRKIFDNLKKFLIFVLGGNFGEILALLFAPFFGPHMPLLPIHILWVNLVTDGLPGLALAAEKGEIQSWWRHPVGRSQKILSRDDWQKIVEIGLTLSACTLFGFYLHHDQGVAYARTIAFTILSLAQLLLVLSLRSSRPLWKSFAQRSDWILVLVVGVSAGLQIAVMANEQTRSWLKLSSLVWQWEQSSGLLLVFFPLIYWELRKIFANKNKT